MVVKIQSEKVSATTRDTRSKTILQEQKIKDPNADFFSDMSGNVSDCSYVDWCKIYSIFDSDDFFFVTNDQHFYINIHNSQLHCIASRPPFMLYMDPVMWDLDHVDLNQWMFNDIDNVSIALFAPEVFSQAYGLKTPKHFFSGKCFDKFLSKSKYEQVVKCWLEDPTLVIPVSLSAYLVSWFREPLSLLAAMFCRLFGLPNISLFKEKWVPMVNHV